jgi:signal recognition particle subunit SRP19
LDSKKKRSEGRRISAADAVDTPTPREICEALLSLGYAGREMVIELNKQYPRDYMLIGRVRFLQREEDKKAAPGDMLIRKVAAFIKALPNRNVPKEAAPAANAAASAAASPAQPESSGKKKKGKK